MPGSGFSIQKGVDDRFARFLKVFGARTEVKRDMVLVMGESTEDLRWWLTAAIFVVQTNPWRWEVDWWKSIVDVNLDFLKGLDKEWLE